MPTVVVFDCESDGRPTRVGQRGEQDFRYVQCTVACAIVLDTKHIMMPECATIALSEAREITCWRDVAPTKGASPFKELLDAFDDADIIVGYNSLDFDLPLLYKHYGSKGSRRYLEHRLKSLDIFSRVRAATNQWPKLDELLVANQLGCKSGDGAKAITLWEAGERKELQSYCMTDVKRTAALGLLPKLRMGGLWIPGHVYGIGPSVHAIRVADAAAACRVQASSPTPSDATEPSETAAADDAFVMVSHPGEMTPL
jgi:hypothetical protein